MHTVTTFQALILIFGALILALGVVGCCYYVFVTRRRKQWPVTDALVQKGAIGWLEHVDNPAVFLGYSFKVNGRRYAGYFVLFVNNDERVQDVYRRLPGTHLKVRYDPHDPNTSFIINHNDPRFEGLAASQDSVLLANAPAFDLRDAVGR